MVFAYDVTVQIPLATSTGKLEWRGTVNVDRRVDSDAGVKELQDAATPLALEWARTARPDRPHCGYVELVSWQLKTS